MHPGTELKGVASGLKSVEVVMGCSSTRPPAASGHGIPPGKGYWVDNSTYVLKSQGESVIEQVVHRNNLVLL